MRHDHRMALGVAHGGVEAEAVELVRQPFGRAAAIGGVGGIGRDGRDADQLEQPVQAGVEIAHRHAANTASS